MNANAEARAAEFDNLQDETPEGPSATSTWT